MVLTGSGVAALDGLLSWWENAEYMAEAFVILGCVGEFTAEFTEIKTLEWRHQLSKVSLLVLIAALAFELVALVRTNGLSGQEIALLNGIAADARTRAANAEGTAKGFDYKIAEAQRGTAEAQRDAKTAEERASKADERASENEKEAAQLQKAAEGERLERIKLEAIVAPRSLSLGQQRLIASACDRFRGHGILVSSYGMDGEAAALGAQIISMLQSVGIIVADARASIVVAGGFEMGVHVRGPDVERDFVSSLGNALSSIGNLKVSLNDPPPNFGSAMGGGGQSFPAGTPFVTVVVGVKPLPILAAK